MPALIRYCAHAILLVIVVLVSGYATFSRQAPGVARLRLGATDAEGLVMGQGGAAGDVELGRQSTIIKPLAAPDRSTNHHPIAYTVRQGDTVKTIAAQFDLSVAEVRWSNPSFESKGRVTAGDHLVLPPTHGVVVTIREGDALDAVAGSYHVDPQAVLDYNYLRDPSFAAPGTVLILPGARGADLADWDSIEEIIRRAFSPQGPEAVSWALRIAACESHYNPNAVNRGSNASGLFQFLPSTWAGSPYSGSSVFDPNANAQAAAWLYRTVGPSQWQCR